MTDEDGRSPQAQEEDASSVKSDAVECDDDDDDDDDDDIGIVFTAPATTSVREGKYCLDKKCNFFSSKHRTFALTVVSNNFLVLCQFCQLQC